MFAEAKARLEKNIIRTDMKTFDELQEYFGAAEDDDTSFKGWVRAPWCKPSKATDGKLLDDIDERLKALKLTIRNAPLGQDAARGRDVHLHRTARRGRSVDRPGLLGRQSRKLGHYGKQPLSLRERGFWCCHPDICPNPPVNS